MEQFWERGLNPEQRRAVLATEGPVLILAGAGSGKTKTLTHRIAYLLTEKKVRPEHILAVTFTNKAAQEMRHRIAELLAPSQADHVAALLPPFIGTFHNICVRILRREIERLGYERNFNILDADDQLALMKRVMKAAEINPDQIRPKALLEALSHAKNTGRSIEELAHQAASYFEELVGKTALAYQAELKRSNSLDFDDLIAYTVELLERFPDVLARYRAQFRYILVDEYQDTNPLQYRLVTLLAGEHRNLFVIGDDYQSIYSWRQADIRNILSFEEDYPDATVITLDRNYRSTQAILDAANEVIRHNVNQRHKKLWTEKTSADKLSLYGALDEEDEARFVIEEIRARHARGEPYRSSAILYRTNAQSRSFEEALLRASIPYRIVGGVKFYQRKEVKDMVAYARFIGNPRDELALERIINEPARGIGRVTLDRWISASRGKKQDFLAGGGSLGSADGLPERKLRAIATFVELTLHFRELLFSAADLDFAAWLEVVARESGYLESLRDGTPEGEMREENVRELFSVAHKFETLSLTDALAHFLEEIALASDTDSIDQAADAVHLMTVHSAKGLEFPAVFLVGLEEGIFPHSRSALSAAELEEERRLMYVGLTRAREQAYLSHAEMRTIFGSTQLNPPSRFIAEIPETLLEERTHAAETESVFFPRRSKARTNSFPRRVKKIAPASGENTALVPDTDLRPGDVVEHPQFGGGVVVALESTLLTVAFKRAGVKKMLLGVAPLKKV